MFDMYMNIQEIVCKCMNQMSHRNNCTSLACRTTVNASLSRDKKPAREWDLKVGKMMAATYNHNLDTDKHIIAISGNLKGNIPTKNPSIFHQISLA